LLSFGQLSFHILHLAIATIHFYSTNTSKIEVQFHLTEDGSCSSTSDGSSIYTEKGLSMSECIPEIPRQCHTPTLVYSQRLHWQPQLQQHHSIQPPVLVPECFAGRIFHSLDKPHNDETISIANFEVD
jgi:hypothetical protein